MRYIYLPLGGRNRRLTSLWLIFIFVGIWHDMAYNWMAFALFNAAGISLESLVHQWIYKSGQNWISTSRSSWVIRILEVCVGGLNVALLTLSNFAINHGFQRMKDFVWYSFMQNSDGAFHVADT
jgi:D-alanyl-lipoteichoic acid acyltransferase DltB (MBOAT superfamily)